MQQRLQYTREEKERALQLLADVGKAEAARLTGIPAGTISSWGVRCGVKAPPITERVEALGAAHLTMAERKQELADELLARARAMIAQLDASMVEKKAHVVSDGAREGSHIEISTVRYDRPPTGAQKQIVETIAILITQVQLLTGNATSRIETNPVTQAEVAQVRGKAVEVLDELAAKRVA